MHACRTGESDGLSGRTVRRNITKPAVKVHRKQPDNSGKSDGSPTDCPPEYHQTSSHKCTRNNRTTTESPTEVQRTPTDTKSQCISVQSPHRLNFEFCAAHRVSFPNAALKNHVTKCLWICQRKSICSHPSFSPPSPSPTILPSQHRLSMQLGD